GEGPGSGGGGGGGAGKTGSVASAPVLTGKPGEKVLGKHWVEYKFVDTNNLPLVGVKYRFKDTAGVEKKSALTLDGRIYKGGLSEEGKTEAELYGIVNPRWSTDAAKADEKLEMNTDTFGIPDGTAARIDVWVTDISGPDFIIDSIEETVKSKKITATWKFPHLSGADLIPNAIAPDFYFTVSVGADKVRSGPVRIRDWIDIELKNDEGKAIANASYVLTTPAGDVRQGKTDANGEAKEDDLPPTKFKIKVV
ncbi:MAG: hypothetical protein OEW08_12790, partial [Gammaproteobacteria bacterium]|nr:hypothetical protein [Gammaproteobacteria bacterium]